VHVHAPSAPHVPASLHSLSAVHLYPVEGEEKLSVIKATIIATWKELLQSVSNLNCAQYYRQQTKECQKIQKAVGNPTAHIFRLTSCPKLGKIKQNIVEKHVISVKKEEK
jgi:hypothetical protein